MIQLVWTQKLSLLPKTENSGEDRFRLKERTTWQPNAANGS